MNFIRRLICDIPKGQSAFLWGARKTGKSTYLRAHFPQSIYYDLLKTDVLARLMIRPSLLREELLACSEAERKHPVVIDEIQKIPALLDEIHWLIEHQKIGFVLCGSSARKLKRGAANLLGGRAWRFHLYPLLYKEIPAFSLQRALNHGLIPSHYLSSNPRRALRAYVSDYLIEEIQAEGLVRHLPGFARFLDTVGFANGEMLHYANMARDCGIDAKTIKAYYQILVDTLIGYLLPPFVKKVKRDLIRSTPKFYLFDVGVANYLARRSINILKGVEAGRAFEHFILMELVAYLGFKEIDTPICYWRSKAGMEVDFVLNGGSVAIEVKISETPQASDIKGLRAFCEDYKPKHAIVVCQAPKKRVYQDQQNEIVYYPWALFLEALWSGKLF